MFYFSKFLLIFSSVSLWIHHNSDLRLKFRLRNINWDTRYDDISSLCRITATISSGFICTNATVERCCFIHSFIFYVLIIITKIFICSISSHTHTQQHLLYHMSFVNCWTIVCRLTDALIIPWAVAIERIINVLLNIATLRKPMSFTLPFRF